MKVHKATTTGDKYLCSQCYKTFDSAFSLKRHMVSGFHKEKPKKKKSITTVMCKVRKFLSPLSEPLLAFKIFRHSYNTIFISAINNSNFDNLRDLLYMKVKELHIKRYPYNNFLY